jgi:hypothetical protein
VSARHLTATCVWAITPELVVRLDEVFGEPTDAYVNGSQVWLRDDGPAGLTIEWRLHPVAGYERPQGVSTASVLGRCAAAVRDLLRPHEEPEVGADSVAADHEVREVGEVREVREVPAVLREPSQLWDGLEAFAAYEEELDHDVEPAVLAAACAASLGVQPDAFGLVDHDAIGDAWEQQQGRRSIVGDLLAQLQPR